MRNATFKETVFTHFVPCIFVGVLFLYLSNTLLPEGIIPVLTDDMFSGPDFALALAVGLGTAGVAVLYHRQRNRRLERIGAVHRRPADRREVLQAAAVGFLAGMSCVLLLLHAAGIIGLTAVVLFILFWNLRVLTGKIALMLHPDTVATWADVAELARIYLVMLAGFTLVNATLEGARILAGNEAAFGFKESGDLFLNALYYTVVTLTTLGYGDITPQTWDAKLLVTAECMISYVMFALVVGIITRGVLRGGEKDGA